MGACNFWAWEQGFSNEVVATSMYGDLKPGSSRVKICLWNLTSQKVTIPAQCVIGQIQVRQMKSLACMHQWLQKATWFPMWPSQMMRTGWALNLLPVRKRVLASSLLRPNQRLQPLIQTILEQTDLSGCISWSPEDLRKPQTCYWSLWMCSLGMTWTWGRPQ